MVHNMPVFYTNTLSFMGAQKTWSIPIPVKSDVWAFGVQWFANPRSDRIQMRIKQKQCTFQEQNGLQIEEKRKRKTWEWINYKTVCKNTFKASTKVFEIIYIRLTLETSIYTNPYSKMIRRSLRINLTYIWLYIDCKWCCLRRVVT